MGDILSPLLIVAFCSIVLIVKKQEKQKQENEIKSFKQMLSTWIQENNFSVVSKFAYHIPKSPKGYYIFIDEEHKQLLIVNLFDLNFELIRFKAILGMQVIEDMKNVGGVGCAGAGVAQVTDTGVFSVALSSVKSVAVVLYLNDFTRPQMKLEFSLSGVRYRASSEYEAVKKFIDRLEATIRVILAQNEKASKG